MGKFHDWLLLKEDDDNVVTNEDLTKALNAAMNCISCMSASQIEDNKQTLINMRKLIDKRLTGMD